MHNIILIELFGPCNSFPTCYAPMTNNPKKSIKRETLSWIEWDPQLFFAREPSKILLVLVVLLFLGRYLCNGLEIFFSFIFFFILGFLHQDHWLSAYQRNNLAQQVSMEYSTAIVFSQLSLFPSTLQTENRTYLFKPWKQRTSQSSRFQCHKMYVPGV